MSDEGIWAMSSDVRAGLLGVASGFSSWDDLLVCVGELSITGVSVSGSIQTQIQQTRFGLEWWSIVDVKTRWFGQNLPTTQLLHPI